jgi:hypothetical protein
MRKLEALILKEKSQNKQAAAVQVMDQKDLGLLNHGAEQTDTDDSEDDSQSRRSTISGSMQRSIDRLLNSTLEEQNQAEGGESSVIDANGKIKFDRKMYDLQTFKSILSKVRRFDYRKQAVTAEDLQVVETSFENMSAQEQPASTRVKKMPPVIDYNDSLSAAEIAHIESIFGRRCGKCATIKVPQSHHCSTCGGCIARMDHHCPWVNNCVGFYNQKHFLLFLIYVFLGSAHALVLTAW